MRQGQESVLKRVGFWVIAVFFTLGSITMQQAYAQQKDPTTCTLATLNGLYVFDATGYNIVNGTPIPKAVAEFLNFKGDGTLTSVATLSVNGNIVQNDAAGTGSYAINQDCTGTLTFSPSGLTFDLFIAHNGSRFHMIETVTGTVLAGSARRVGR
jgi:DNA/RNA endonuclease YhcR with UshA esterase domain